MARDAKETNAAAVPSVTKSDTGMTLSVQFEGGIVHCANKIDLTPYSTMTFRGIPPSSDFFRTGLYIWSEFGSDQVTNVIASHEIDAENIEIDISTIDRECIIGFGSQGFVSYTIKELCIK